MPTPSPRHTLAVVFMLCASRLMAADASLDALTRAWYQRHPDSDPHWLTPAEAQALAGFERTFQQTDPPSGPVREVAEFERMGEVLIRYPFGIPMDLIAALAEETPLVTLVSSASQENTVRSQYLAAGIPAASFRFVRASTNSYWTRDYGPWYIQTDEGVAVVDFPYNRPRPLDDEVPVVLAADQGLDLYGMPVVQTGGNWMADGYGTAASTNLVVEENPDLDETQIDQRVAEYMGAQRYFKRPDPNNTYIDHIDCWAKFLDVDKVLVREVPTSHAQYAQIEAAAQFFETATSGWGTPYQVFRVWTPNNQPYTNSLLLNGRVFVPVTGSSWDDEALAVYRQALPGWDVQGFTGSWESTDALHCRTRGLADPGLLHIHHTPLDSVAAFSPIQLDASILASSGQPLVEDSLACRYRVDGGAWQRAPLLADGDGWSASLPALAPGQTLDYLLQAADASGRFEQAPFVGIADPFRLVARAGVVPAPQVTIQVAADGAHLAWSALPGATGYRIEAWTPESGWTSVGLTRETAWSSPLDAPVRLFRVVALF